MLWKCLFWFCLWSVIAIAIFCGRFPFFPFHNFTLLRLQMSLSNSVQYCLLSLCSRWRHLLLPFSCLIPLLVNGFLSSLLWSLFPPLTISNLACNQDNDNMVTDKEDKSKNKGNLCNPNDSKTTPTKATTTKTASCVWFPLFCLTTSLIPLPPQSTPHTISNPCHSTFPFDDHLKSTMYPIFVLHVILFCPLITKMSISCRFQCNLNLKSTPCPLVSNQQQPPAHHSPLPCSYPIL